MSADQQLSAKRIFEAGLSAQLIRDRLGNTLMMKHTMVIAAHTHQQMALALE